MCRRLFPIVAIDPHFVPPYLHPYLLPPFRKLYLDTTLDLPCPNPGPGPAKWQETREQLENERDRLRAENAVLRTSCAAWRRRADAHAAVHIGLATFARLARDYARMMHVQRDELAQRCESLKRKYGGNDNDNGDDEDEDEFAHESSTDASSSPIFVPPPSSQSMTPTLDSSSATSTSVHAVEAEGTSLDTDRHRSKKRRVENQEDEAMATQPCHRPGIYIAAVPAH